MFFFSSLGQKIKKICAFESFVYHTRRIQSLRMCTEHKPPRPTAKGQQLGATWYKYPADTIRKTLIGQKMQSIQKIPRTQMEGSKKKKINSPKSNC